MKLVTTSRLGYWLGASLLVACASDPPSTSDAPATPDPVGESPTTALPRPAPDPESARWPGDVAVELVRGCPDATCQVPSLAVEVTSLRTDPAELELALSGDGLDGRHAQIVVATGVTLQPGERRQFTIAADQLPIQARGTLASARAELRVNPGGAWVGSVSSPVVYEHSVDWHSITAYSDDAAATWAAQHDTASLAPPIGRVWDHGAFVDVTTLPALGGAGFTLGGGATMLSAMAPARTAMPPPPPQGNPPPPGTTTVCFDLKVQYNDAGVGEDYVNAGTGVQTQNASYMKAWITRTSGMFSITIWSGYLNAAGCSPYITLSAGTDVIHVQSSLEKPVDAATGHHDIKLHSGFGDNLVSWSRSFTIASPSPTSINVEALANDHTMNVAGVLARMYAGTDTWVPAGTNTTYVDKGCPGLTPPTDSCFAPGDAVYIGPGPGAAIAPPQATDKFLVAHEHGHFVQSFHFPIYGYDYNAVIDSVGACRCDQVVSANQLHCIQSLEQYAAAFLEGFAHFYASKLYNNRLEADCTFGYYKEVYILFGVLSPTVPVACASTSEWRDSHCTAIANSAVEMDTMRFYWALYSTLPDRFTMDEIAALFSAAQTHAGFLPITWSDLKAGAATVFGAFTPKYNKVVSQAAIHSVD